MNSTIPRAQTRDLKLIASWPARVFPNHEWVLLLVLFFEFVIFSITGDNFFTAANAFEITRLSVEVGLLALALTFVIITGGIDLSVGSMMGLVAVVLGRALARCATSDRSRRWNCFAFGIGWWRAERFTDRALQTCRR